MNQIAASPSVREERLLDLLHPNLNQASPHIFYIWACGSSKGSPENKPLVVIIFIRLLVTTKVWPVGRGVKTSGHPSLLCYHTLCSMLGAVERDFVSFVGVNSEHRVTTDHEHQSELGFSGLDHHH